MNLPTALAWLVTGVSILAHYLAMRKVWWAPIFGLFKELCWISFCLATPNALPLVIACVFYIVIYARAIPKWYKEK